MDKPPPGTIAGCGVGKGPKDAPACIDERLGLFVSPSGSDANDGTKARPFKTLGGALAKLEPSAAYFVYLCEGRYSENVTVTKDARIFGGLSCGDWTYNGKHAVVVGAAGSSALTVTGVKDLGIEDVDFEAANATEIGGSSIAGFISASTVRLRRTSFTARTGKSADAGKAGGPPPAGPAPDGSRGGNESSPPYSGGAPTPNPSCPTAVGGAGGGGGTGRARDGEPAVSPRHPDDNANGLGGTLGNSGPGTRGSDGRGGVAGAGAARAGVITAAGWQAEAGKAGGNGGVGQGGGGQGGHTYTGGGEVYTAWGGGGAPGGCGGNGGGGGKTGGSSIALGIFNSQVSIEESLFTAGLAGNGGDGGAGQLGQAGGRHQADYSAGDGGSGGSGGGGGGGSGGISAGIVWTGTTAPRLGGNQVESAPTFAGITVAAAGGAGGKGGGGAGPAVPGSLGGAAGTPGAPGAAAAILQAK